MSALRGKTIIATCDIKKADKLDQLLVNHGAQLIKLPLIKTSAADNLPQKSTELISTLENLDWIIFTSSNGVLYFFEWLKKIDISAKNYQWKYAVIGKGTGETLIEAGIDANYISKSKHSGEFGKELKSILGKESKNILISAGNLAPDNLLNTLNTDHNCQKIITYKTENIRYETNEIFNLLKNQENIIVLFMSPSAVEGFYNLDTNGFKQFKFEKAVIGQITEKALIAQGEKPDFMPTNPNLEILIQELAKYYENKQHKYIN